jgi:transcription initiation factor IIE alpha subunit
MSDPMHCDCGCEALMRFGPYNDKDGSPEDAGLRWIFTCSRCGEQLRVYQTSEAWRAKHPLTMAS